MDNLSASLVATPMKHLAVFLEGRNSLWHSLGWLSCLALAILITAYNWLPLRSAAWSLIDDHEVIAAIGARPRLPVSEIYQQLLQTEVADPTRTRRFRPAYYLLRFVEAATWGKNVSLWYWTRIFIAGAFALFLTHFCVRFAGPILSLGFLAFALSRPYWSGIFSGLGPGETYAALGVALIYAGMSQTFTGRLSCWAWGFTALGTVIAAGSKENFLIVGFLLVWLLFLPRTRVSTMAKIGTGIILMYVGWIGLTIIRVLSQTGVDVYLQSTSASSRLVLLSEFIMRPDVLIWSIAIALVLLVAVSLRIIASKDSVKALTASHKLIHTATALSLLFFLFACQFIFYNGKWPSGTAARYLFPGLLAKHLALLVGGATLVYLICTGLHKPRWAISVSILISAGFLVAARGDWQDNRAQSKNVVETSRRFMSKMETTKDYLWGNPSAALILNSYSMWDFEPVFSVARFIRAAGITNSIAVQFHRDLSGTSAQTPLEVQLSKELTQFQLSGGGESFVPLASVDISKDCFSLGFHGPPLEDCRGLTVWPD
jgi:hypothetical protein